MHHFYRVMFVCQPGGSRKTEYHVVGTLAEVKEVVEDDLSSPLGAYHAILYGEDIAVECWEGDRRVARIDLHPFVSYRLSDRDEVVRFQAEGNAAAIDLTSGEGQALAEALDR